jgi:hypothetical protein
MKIIIERNKRESQGANVTLDTEGLIYPYAIREALELALELDGHSKQAIAKVFNRGTDAKREPSEPVEEKPVENGLPKYKVGDCVCVYYKGTQAPMFITSYVYRINGYYYGVSHSADSPTLYEVYESNIMTKLEKTDTRWSVPNLDISLVEKPKYNAGDIVVFLYNGCKKEGKITGKRLDRGIKVYDIQGQDFIGCYDENEIVFVSKFP